MNRILFQLGLLGFFGACVFFGLEGFPMFESIGRAFIVFIAVVIAGTTLLGLTAWIALGSKNTPAVENTSALAPAPEKSKG
jgi:hypothetical protein